VLKMSAYKIQTPGNYPEENIQHVLTQFMCFTYSVHPYIQSGQFMQNTYTEIPVKSQSVCI
jgi:hypothetical protein